MPKQDYEEKYAHPDLREKIKEEIKASGKGGQEGQWSARKSQLTVDEVKSKVQGLSRDDIEAVRDYEKNNANRKTLLKALDCKV